jgi:hypothetical protein
MHAALPMHADAMPIFARALRALERKEDDVFN